ncbi:hypothetical protein CEXT_418671 [Caerostris extrusa]|uniref:Uncharacterized protein n=1 Tax=Caerostris extrusa TaxID=172846 RepID=A0AAV4VL57_CAEEX|nr:hypothetical protein CEXT_418671 [Caerostris extrusa]
MSERLSTERCTRRSIKTTLSHCKSGSLIASLVTRNVSNATTSIIEVTNCHFKIRWMVCGKSHHNKEYPIQGKFDNPSCIDWGMQCHLAACRGGSKVAKRTTQTSQDMISF